VRVVKQFLRGYGSTGPPLIETNCVRERNAIWLWNCYLRCGIFALSKPGNPSTTASSSVLDAGGTLENDQAMAAHESPRTTKLYDRTGDEITLDEVERISI